MDSVPENIRYLRYLAKEYPSQEEVAEGIVNMRARLNLPKGTEHFISDIHGEYDSFCEVVSHASGAIKRKIDEIFQHTLVWLRKKVILVLLFIRRKQCWGYCFLRLMIGDDGFNRPCLV